ncbi:MAG: protein TolR [Betaproteobacteria bacterium RBG_16_64_18]|nr:MAG: protein TolR [Betaproteobacteria bacterium RBG_16_64_18]OGA42214.1 MAG: protein TolR [Betaproteobacteria bacterium RIFCSPLOWO2_12_FULL_65_110]
MRPRRLMNQINVVPYVDVMLVLLVIFMVTAPLVTTGVIDLPSVNKSAQVPVAPLEVIIRTDSSLTLRERSGGQRGGGGGQTQERRVSTAELVAALRDKQARNPDQPVVIAADKDVRYEAVLKVMDELQKAGIRRVGLLVKAASR